MASSWSERSVPVQTCPWPARATAIASSASIIWQPPTQKPGLSAGLVVSSGLVTSPAVVRLLWLWLGVLHRLVPRDLAEMRIHGRSLYLGCHAVRPNRTEVGRAGVRRRRGFYSLPAVEATGAVASGTSSRPAPHDPGRRYSGWPAYRLPRSGLPSAGCITPPSPPTRR